MESHRKRSIEVAQHIKKLVAKFSTAQLQANRHAFEMGTRDLDESGLGNGLENVSLQISRETYLHVIRDHDVEQLMDDLEISNERGSLFDALDADASGTVSLRELIQGLLRVGGDTSKSDVVSSVLGVRALLEIVHKLEGNVTTNQHTVMSRIDAIEKKIDVLGISMVFHESIDV